MPVTPAVTSTTLSAADTYTHVRVDATQGAFTVYLPAAADVKGHELSVVKVDASSYTVTIAVGSGSGDALNLPTGRNSLTTQWQSLRLRSTGSAWELAA